MFNPGIEIPAGHKSHR